jgi:predicted transcriptional regulator
MAPAKKARTRKDRPTTRKKTPAKPAGRKKKPVPKDRQRSTEPKSDEERAHVWVLFEEGHSQREIARQTGMGARTVQRILREDPGRLEALAALQRDERRLLWREIENQALRGVQQTMREAMARLFDDDGKAREGLMEIDRVFVAELPKVGRWMGRIAKDASTHVSLLSGDPTDRVALAGGLELDVLSATDEELIDEAKRLGLEEKLPARLREKL